MLPHISSILGNVRIPTKNFAWNADRGNPMLDEQQTLTILGWTVGSLSIGLFLLSALATH
jgi:hypothetical protein